MGKLHRISKALQRINTAVFLLAAYVLGIGVVSLVGRAMGVKFLDEEVTNTNWKKPTGSQNPERMF